VSKPTTLIARAANCVVILINCVVILICAATVAAAQAQPTPRPVAPPATAASPVPSPAVAKGEPDLSITANVTARELLFEVVPSPRVEFPGQPRRDTVWEAERTNLPAQAQPGVTYRDIGIRLTITSVFADIERIVAEALGEIPLSDDAAPKINSDENAQPPAAAAPRTQNEATPPPPLPGLAPASISSTQPSPALSPARAGQPRRNSGGAGARRERP
jgi:hypothetical protein